ncbi:MAG: hypothetical protein D6732_11170 [Methanobacteriota archaeon]|nr:MAG: hypothetical protein D6732_11170 [Euryarchaeota archaeon]
MRAIHGKEGKPRRGNQGHSDIHPKVNENEPNTLLYRPLQHAENPNAFTHYMVFRNEEARTHHQKTEWVKEFVERLYPLLVERPRFVQLNSIEELIIND